MWSNYKPIQYDLSFSACSVSKLSSNWKFLIFFLQIQENQTAYRKKQDQKRSGKSFLTINYIQSYRPVGGILEMFLSLIQSHMKTKREKKSKEIKYLQ